MSELSVLLIPLQTLPGYPAAPTPSLMEFLLLLIIIPGLIGVLVPGLTMGRSWLGQARGENAAIQPCHALPGRAPRGRARVQPRPKPRRRRTAHLPPLPANRRDR